MKGLLEMALSAEALTPIITAALNDAQGEAQNLVLQNTANEKLAEGIANAIIPYLIANTVVSVVVGGVPGAGTIS